MAVNLHRKKHRETRKASMSTEPTDTEIFRATYTDYAIRGKAAIEGLREASPVDFVRLGAFITRLSESDFEKLAAEIEAKLQTAH
jgi:hypothetical protein